MLTQCPNQGPGKTEKGVWGGGCWPDTLEDVLGPLLPGVFQHTKGAPQWTQEVEIAGLLGHQGWPCPLLGLFLREHGVVRGATDTAPCWRKEG